MVDDPVDDSLAAESSFLETLLAVFAFGVLGRVMSLDGERRRETNSSRQPLCCWHFCVAVSGLLGSMMTRGMVSCDTSLEEME